MSGEVVPFPASRRNPPRPTPTPNDPGGHSMADRVVMGFVILGTASYWGMHLYNFCAWVFSLS